MAIHVPCEIEAYLDGRLDFCFDDDASHWRASIETLAFTTSLPLLILHISFLHQPLHALENFGG
jgi:hypothetical protein